MPALDDISSLEQTLSQIRELLSKELYQDAGGLIEQWQQQWSDVYLDTAVNISDQRRLRQMADEFQVLISQMLELQLQIKNRIKEIDQVQLPNRVSKTYQAE